MAAVLAADKGIPVGECAGALVVGVFCGGDGNNDDVALSLEAVVDKDYLREVVVVIDGGGVPPDRQVPPGCWLSS